MTINDFYYLADKDMQGIFLTTKSFWKKVRHIPSTDYPEWGKILPEGFVNEAENFYRYYQKSRICYNKGLKILQEAGFQEIHWGDP